MGTTGPDQAAAQDSERDSATDRLLAAAEAMGVEIDRDEADRWMDAVSTDSGGNVMVDVDTGVYGHRVSMADYEASDIDRFRRLARIVGLEDRPPAVTTALALSGSAAQARIHRFPADADFFERIHIQAESREAACLVLATVLRDKAMATMRGAGHRLQEIKFGNWPVDGSIGGAAVKRGTPVSWTPAQVEAAAIAFEAADGGAAILSWDDAALDPGWCKLDWVIAVPGEHGLANVSNMFDATWEAPDGAITPLDGFLDSYFQEVYLETASIPLFSKLVKEMGADSVAEYVEALRGEVYTYTVEHPNYGKAARRLYNIFRLTGQYAEAAFIRELFDEPVTALYQVAAMLRTLGEADDAGDAFATEAMVAEFDGLIMSTIAALEGRAEVEMVRRLLRLREEFARRALKAVTDSNLAEARADAMEAVDEYFKRVLEGVPSIKAYLEELATSR